MGFSETDRGNILQGLWRKSPRITLKTGSVTGLKWLLREVRDSGGSIFNDAKHRQSVLMRRFCLVWRCYASPD